METLQVLNFQLTPYSDETVQYVNGLTSESIYRLFTPTERPEVLTAGLFALHKLESEARDAILKHKPVETSYILRKAQLLCPDAFAKIDNPYATIIHRRILFTLKGTYGLDNLLFSKNFNELGLYPNAFALVINGFYAGHCYAWTVENTTTKATVTNIYGMRSSILQLIIGKCGLKQPHITMIFLNAIRRWVNEVNEVNAVNEITHYLRALQPPNDIVKLFTDCGFVLAKRIRNVHGYNWLFDNGSLGDTSLAANLSFREYDYLIPAHYTLPCNAPVYEYIQI